MIANSLNKQYGKEYGRNGIVAVSADEIIIPKRFTTGSLSLDVILGGGFPGNLWTEIRGKESAGKTSLMFKSIAANQRLDPNFHAFWVAAEWFNPDQAKALGVDTSRVTVVQTAQMEFALQAMLDAAQSQEVDMIVLDSLPALSPDEEVGKAMDEFTTALGARLMNKWVRKAGHVSNRSMDGTERPFTGIIINQYRDKMGSPARPGMIPQTTPGGHGKDYFYHVILKLAREDWITEKRNGFGDVKVGQTIKATTEKNKTAPPQQAVSIDFYMRNAPLSGFKRGEFDSAKDYMTMAILFGVVNKKGAWYYFKEEKWHGKDELLAALREDISLREEIAELVLSVASTPEEVDKLVAIDDAEE